MCPTSISRRFRFLLLKLALSAGACLVVASVQASTNFTSLAAFDNLRNGYGPEGPLIFYTNNYIYGTAGGGGPYSQGTVFKMAPDGTLSVLVAFNGTNGQSPGALTLARDGNFYGTTLDGGISNNGTIFRMSPDGDLTTLVSFVGTNGQWPSPQLLEASDGNLYGTTSAGGAYNYGTVFKMLPNGSLTTVASFANTNGLDCMAGLVQAADGNFYGTTRLGGSYGLGTIFRVTPTGNLTNLVSFDYFTNGCWPTARLIQATDGNLYGTTFGQLSGGGASVFRVTTNGQLTTLVRFNGTNGSYSQTALVQASDRCLYGITERGGPTGQYGPGTIFRLTLDGTFATVYAFTGIDDGTYPSGALVQGPDGNLYGTTSEGGPQHSGNIFCLSLPMRPILQPPSFSNSGLDLTWSAAAGQNYQVEYCTNLDLPSWTALGPPLPATTGVLSTSDLNPTDPQRFYRVTVLP
jgi:uncharacterized repeat protein (TIGR03803 family)